MARKKTTGGVRTEGRARQTRLPGAPDGSAYDFVVSRTKIPRGAILTPADGSPAFRVERSNGFVISGLEIGGKGRPKKAGIDLRQTDAGLDLSGSF